MNPAKLTIKISPLSFILKTFKDTCLVALIENFSSSEKRKEKHFKLKNVENKMKTKRIQYLQIISC